MGGTVEDVVDRIREKAAFRAVVIRHLADAQLEVLQLSAVAGPKLREDSTGRPRERRFCRVDRRSRET